MTPPSNFNRAFFRTFILLDACIRSSAMRRGIAAFFAVLYETGMRPGEAYQLRWERIRFDRGIIEIRHDPKAGVRTKTDKTRTVPMATRCRELRLEVWGTVKIGPFANLDHRRAKDHWLGARRALGINNPDCIPYATRRSPLARDALDRRSGRPASGERVAGSQHHRTHVKHVRTRSSEVPGEASGRAQ